MFDGIIVGSGSADGIAAYYLAKRDNKGNMNIVATKDTQAP
jgi:ribulose 1,5-bisphosphate synthetase/thiazole synthase